VLVLAHDVQQEQIEAAGGEFLAYQTAPQVDQSRLRATGDDPVQRFMGFELAARDDLVSVAKDLGPALLLVDCMLPSALTAAQGEGYKTVALVHAIYSFWCEFAGGLFKAPIDRADLALGLTYKAFDRRAQFPPNLVFVGPARPDLDAQPWARGEPGKPLVLACQSSGIQSPQQAAVLQRVCDAVTDLDVEALVTTGRGIAPESLRVGSNTTAERLVPHDAVLPQADLLITHGGHGTVMAGVRYGVPML
jgi:hypothetical protein